MGVAALVNQQKHIFIDYQGKTYKVNINYNHVELLKL
jgi:hypothetical protein